MQTKYSREKEFLNSVEDNNQRELVNEMEANKLIESFPNIPLDYIDYLKEIGAGSFMDSRYMVYSSLMELKDFGIEDNNQKAINIKFFGDNFSGDIAGFDLTKKDGYVIEFWHDSGELNYTKKKFQNYIKEQMQIEDSNDKSKPWWKVWR